MQSPLCTTAVAVAIDFDSVVHVRDVATLILFWLGKLRDSQDFSRDIFAADGYRVMRLRIKYRPVLSRLFFFFFQVKDVSFIKTTIELNFSSRR